MLPPFPPVEPEPTLVRVPDPRDAGDEDVVAIGADFRAGTLLEAYRHGIFPWPDSRGRVPWCSVDPRAIFEIADPPHWSRSLRRTLRLTPFTCTVDQAFREVITACGDERPDARWIVPRYLEAFCELHALGWTHSVEVWEGSGAERELVGGIDGVTVGGLFAGESMFHRRTDASKIAFATLVGALRASGYELFDVQVLNPHLESLGCVEIARDEYLDRVERAVARPALELALP